MGNTCSNFKSKHSSQQTKDQGSKNTSKDEKDTTTKQDSDENDDMSSNTAEVLKTLSEIPLLSSLKETDQRKMAKQFKSRDFKIGDNLMKQGDKGTEFFIIISGKCSVRVTSDADSGDDNMEIAVLSDGDYCGEQALLKDAVRGATICAVEDTKCLTLDQKAFQEIVSESNIHFAKREAKRVAVSAEGMGHTIDTSSVKGDLDFEKTQQTKDWLLKCVEDNILFSNLEIQQRQIVIEHMYKLGCKEGEFLITQGEEGNMFYVLETGCLNVLVKDIGQVDSLKPGKCVGELALLYNAPRAASVQASEDSKVWCVDRNAFRKALMEVHSKETSKNVEFLKKCSLLSSLLSSELILVDQALEKETFKAGETIFKTGEEGDKLYLVKEGTVKGTVEKDGTNFQLNTGGFFGERALLRSEPRAATVVAHTDALCLTLCREDFNMLLGPLTDIMERNMEEYDKPLDERKPLGHNMSDGSDICALDEFKTIGILGRGAFGTVKLVLDDKTGKSYALKAIRKNQVVELGQQSHILNEKAVMQMLDNKFLVNLRATYKDTARVYFLLEACLGGELFTILRKMRSFDEPTARFYTGCVVEAFDYMHQRDVIYRDLKPENLVLTGQGYLKVTDFGFAKVVASKTFTLCGTPDYLAPEIVTGQGHGKGVDWWTLGILIYEMLASFPPFFDDEPMMTYRKIIQGKFKFPRYLSAHSKDLVCKFLKTKPTKRYGVIKGGATLIKTHAWFKDFDWKGLREGTLKPPIRPKVKSADDISNFDHFQERQEDLTYKGDPDLGWDKDF